MKAETALNMLKEAETEPLADLSSSREASPSQTRHASSSDRSNRTTNNRSASPPAERVRARPSRPTSPMAGRTNRDRGNAKDINKVIANDYKRIERNFFGFLGIRRVQLKIDSLAMQTGRQALANRQSKSKTTKGKTKSKTCSLAPVWCGKPWLSE